MIGRLFRLLTWFETVVSHPFTVRAGIGARVQRPARIRGRLTLHPGAVIFRGLDCVGPVSVGARSFINAHAYLRPHVTIGTDVAVGSHVLFVTDTHELTGHARRAGNARHLPITVGDGAWIGAGVILLPGVTIGDGAVVGAGSVVAKDVPADSLVTGPGVRLRRHLPSDSPTDPEEV